MTATLKDVAQKVGRSVTTVSRALADYDDVSPKTKALVRQVAAELNYTPNISAQRLRKRHTQTLGLIFSTFDSHFIDTYFNEILTGISSEAAKHVYDLLVSTCPAIKWPGEPVKQPVMNKNLSDRSFAGFPERRWSLNQNWLIVVL